jgi:hypothetical protein
MLIAMDCAGHGGVTPHRSWIIARLDVAAAAMVRQDGGGYTVVLQAKSYLLEEGLGDMESVDIVSLSHNRHRRLGVSFRHGQRALMAVRGVVEAAFGACRQSRKSFRKTLGSYASFW